MNRTADRRNAAYPVSRLPRLLPCAQAESITGYSTLYCYTLSSTIISSENPVVNCFSHIFHRVFTVFSTFFRPTRFVNLHLVDASRFHTISVLEIK